MKRLHGTLVVATAVLLIGMPRVVSSTPPAGLGETTLAQGVSPDGIVVAARGTTDVIVREITIAPGGSTGWHYHDGELIAVVKSGTLTRRMPDCSTVAISAGGSFTEPAGREHTHLGRNLGAAPVVLLVTYLVPAGQPLSRDAPPPANCVP